MPRRYLIFLVVGILTAIADQLTKIWARATLPTTEQGWGMPVSVIENLWDWRLSENPGAAFGMFGGTTGARVFLSIIGVVAVIAIVWMVKKAREDQKRLLVALGLVAGGAVGNLIDRVAFGVVTDFVVWRYHDTEWPTFNIADVALVVGVGLLFIDIGKEAKDEAREAKAKKAGASGRGKRKS
jgi:signal peptidase II